MHSLLYMGRNLLSAVPPIFPICLSHRQDSLMRLTCACVQSYYPPSGSFTLAAPVGNSCSHLNAGTLAAGGLPSLCGNDALLYTFIAFKNITVSILGVFPINVKIFFRQSKIMRNISILCVFQFYMYAFGYPHHS